MNFMSGEKLGGIVMKIKYRLDYIIDAVLELEEDDLTEEALNAIKKGEPFVTDVDREEMINDLADTIGIKPSEIKIVNEDIRVIEEVEEELIN